MTVALVGYGSLGMQVRGLLEAAGRDDFILFDDHAVSSGTPGAHPLRSCVEPQHAGAEFYVCLGYLRLVEKQEWLGRLLSLGRRLPAWVHPSSFVSPRARIGAGAIVYPGCNVDQGVVIGDGALLNNSVVVSHDSEVGAGAFLAPGAVICGLAKIGSGTFIGAGAIVSNGVRVGRGCRIGAASLVGSDLTDGASAVGNPLKVLQSPLELR